MTQEPFQIWNGESRYGNAKHVIYYNVSFYKELYLTACVLNPYILLSGPIQIRYNASQYIYHVTCENCMLQHCINRTIWQDPGQTVMLLKRPVATWLPVKLKEPWQETPSVAFMLELLKHLKHRSKRFVGLLIAGIFGLAGLIASASTAAVALHQEVQTTHYLQQFHRNYTETWQTQVHIDQEILSEVQQLKDSVIWLGEQVQDLRWTQRLQCHYNITHFCVTRVPYNNTEVQWQSIRNHLMGLDPLHNASLNVLKLQSQVLAMVNAQTPTFDNEELWNSLAEGISSLNPFKYFSTHIAGLLALTILLIVFLFLFCVICRAGWKRLKDQENMVPRLIMLAMLQRNQTHALRETP